MGLPYITARASLPGTAAQTLACAVNSHAHSACTPVQISMAGRTADMPLRRSCPGQRCSCTVERPWNATRTSPQRAQELRSLTQQLSFSYAANARAAAPAHLHLTSAAGRMGDMLLRQVSGLHNWHVTRSDQAYIDLFAGRTDELVYLTAGTHPAGGVCFEADECALIGWQAAAPDAGL